MKLVHLKLPMVILHHKQTLKHTQPIIQMEVKVGEEPVKVATNKSVLKNVGKAIATVGAPLPTALLDAYFINEQVKEGKGTAEIAKQSTKLVRTCNNGTFIKSGRSSRNRQVKLLVEIRIESCYN